MKISIIAWDGSFREKHHTIHAFGNQSLSKDKFELIWVDYYKANDELINQINLYPNFRILNLERPAKEQWHLGKCINAGVSVCEGNLLVIPDGDIIVDKDFLLYVYQNHLNNENLVMYHWRYEESKETYHPELSYTIDHLEKNTKLLYPLNYAACYSIRKKHFKYVNGYEEHNCYSGAGMQATEINVRFKNAGLNIQWDKAKKTFHPWHPNTAITSQLNRTRNLLRSARIHYDWINPYAGIEQSWVYRCRLHNLDIYADEKQCDEYLENIKNIDLEVYNKVLDIFN